jgi:hypothetical protein
MLTLNIKHQKVKNSYQYNKQAKQQHKKQQKTKQIAI